MLAGSSRAVLAVAAFTSFAGAFVTAPIAARGAGDTPAAVVPLATPAAAPRALIVVVPRRDPFAGAPPADARRGSAVATPAMSSAAPERSGDMPERIMPLPSSLGPLPPNAGAGEAARPFAIPAPAPAQRPPARVTAVITGTHPFALIDEGGTTRLVTLGDRIGEDAVAAISGTGVRLANGRTLPLAPDPTSLPPAHGDR
ncbi:MAG TPA: hypothetical protein VK669_00790 [Candidatus Limnocylindrales bacterium]|nr:hypothetical protein [Candidatus Limnocylindrales bacterium]